MSKALNSPTARLLRNSRLFSLPPPLPAASLEGVTSSGILRSSDTATLPYPTHQAISTPPSSRHRGDWGLKRPLPNRSIPKSNAHLRIKAIDNLNHITEFASAADHTQTVQKWQDLNLPMSMAQKRDSMTRASRSTPISAFEDDVDNTAFASSHAKDLDSTAISAERAIQLRSLPLDQARQRWKTEGPWVNGLTEEEFQQYLSKTVRKNKAGFMRFLEQVKINQKKQQIVQTMRDEGLLSEQDPKAFELELEKQSQLEEHELSDYVKLLRDTNSGLSSDLSALVRQYFDLPHFPTVNEANDALQSRINVQEDTSFENPPATHPSAGLSYLRTKAFMQNHPQHGPQASHDPVQARVVRPRSVVGNGNDRRANLGVAGFVTEESGHATFSPRNKPARESMSPEQRYVYDLSQLDTEAYGGNKVWVNPTKAHVDEKGYIQLTVERADEQAVGVKTGNPIEAPHAHAAPTRWSSGGGGGGAAGGRLNDRLDAQQQRPAPGTRGNANFGKALPDERTQRRRDIKGFGSEELGNVRGGQQQQQQNDDEQLETIRKLASQHLNAQNKVE